MSLTTAERNRRKRERKKKEREQQRKDEEEEAAAAAQKAATDVEAEDDDAVVEVEYVAELPLLPDEFAEVRRLQEQSMAWITDDEERHQQYASQLDVDDELGLHNDDDDYEERRRERQQNEGDDGLTSKRKLKEMLRPTVADLKLRVSRPDLVEAHDVTAPDPEFLIELKGAAHTVSVPRHWGRKRKYLQGKRGFEKPPFKLPDFITNTGITDLRDTVSADENAMSAKQKNRQRVAPKMGAIDVDYRTLHDAFFKHQTKPTHLTRFGDVYYEGKELETRMEFRPGAPLSAKLRDSLGMAGEDTIPPPWLFNMQRYGPPPSFPHVKIAGLNAPLPSANCQYGFHPGGWGRPPVDAYNRPLYGGNPFDPPGAASTTTETDLNTTMVTSDGKTLTKAGWGALPTGMLAADEDVDESEGEEDSDMEESDDADGEQDYEPAPTTVDGVESVLPPPPGTPTTAFDLRKQPGDETPAPGTKQLYKVIDQTRAAPQVGAVFASEVAYDMAGAQSGLPEGAESVLSKAQPAQQRKKKDDEEEEELGKNFKF